MTTYLTPEMLYRDWLHLRRHLLWCYDHAVQDCADVVHIDGILQAGAWLVRDGWIEVNYDNQILRAMPGEWLIVKPGPRVQSYPRGTRLLSIAWEATWPDGTHWLEEGLPVLIDCDAYPRLEVCGRRLAGKVNTPLTQWDARHQRMNVHSFLRIEKALNNWFGNLINVLAEHDIYPTWRFMIDDRVLQALRLLDSRPLHKPLDREALAQQVGISLIQLTRLFNHDLHTSPWKYFDNRRFEYARERLSMSDARIKDVAFALGFHHLPNFSAWFKRASGQSPRAFCQRATESL